MADRDIAVRNTLGFVTAHLATAPGRRILEVGCGRGDVALGLGQADYDVVAVDSSAECVESAAAKGVDARQARWPEFHESGFDAVLFTRSLHHMHELAGALDKAVEVLNPSGLLIVEDFDYAGATPSHANWIAHIARLVEAAGSRFAEGSLCRLMLESGGDLEVWRQQHDHDLHDAETMRDEIDRRLELRESADAPYLYRYFVEGLETEDIVGILESVLELECAMGELNGLVDRAAFRGAVLACRVGVQHCINDDGTSHLDSLHERSRRSHCRGDQRCVLPLQVLAVEARVQHEGIAPAGRHDQPLRCRTL